jgi:hypothetical protein
MNSLCLHTLPPLPARREDQAHFRPWHLLCGQLQAVVGEVLRYTSIDVLEPLWCDMYARLVQAGNMDEVRLGTNQGLGVSCACVCQK